MRRVSIVGGSGYAGGEFTRILLDHPNVKIQQVTSERFAGQPVTRLHPNLRGKTRLTFSKVGEIEACDILFVCLPNTVSMTYMKEFRKKAAKIIDLGADFRLRSQKEFESWYGVPHREPKLLPKFVYGLPELHRDQIRSASYISC